MDLETKVNQLQEELGAKGGKNKPAGELIPRPPEVHCLSGFSFIM